MRAATSLLFLLSFALGFAQAFGRYGYVAYPTVPGLSVTKEGIRAKSGSADILKFKSAARQFRPIEVSDQGATYLLTGGAESPAKLRVSSYGPGVELYFPLGMTFKVSSLQAPYLSWYEGSVGENVPAPKSSWVLVSFRESEPPILIAFPGNQAELKVEGRPGDWRIKSDLSFQGWVRISLPFGVRSLAANNAAALGEQVEWIKRGPENWILPSAKLLTREARTVDGGILGVWTFDRPGALIPTGMLLAARGGDPIILRSGASKENAPTEEGPTSFCVSDKLVVFFPLRIVAPGRSVTFGPPPQPFISTVSPFDTTGIAELAMTSLLGPRDILVGELSNSITDDFVAACSTEIEPNTGQRLLFNGTGKGLDLAAAHALLDQAIQLATNRPRANSLLTSILWMMDSASWRISAQDPTASARANTLVGLASLLSAEPDVRLSGAMLRAGAASQRALPSWLALAVPSSGPFGDQAVESPLGMLLTGSPSTPFEAALLAPLKVISEHTLTLSQNNVGTLISWPVRDVNGDVIELTGVTGVLTAGANLARFEIIQIGTRTLVQFVPKAAGNCTMVMVGGTSPPVTPAIPSL